MAKIKFAAKLIFRAQSLGLYKHNLLLNCLCFQSILIDSGLELRKMFKNSLQLEYNESTRSSSVTDSDARMFNNPLYSDIEISIDNVNLCAHRFVISRNAYCQKTFCDFKVYKIFGERESSPLDKKYAAAYWRAFEFIYKGTYENILSTEGLCDDSDLLRDVRVHRIAELFELDELKNLAKTRLEEKVGVNLKNLEEFSECVREIYTTTADPNLRYSVVIAVVKKDPDLCHDILMEGGQFVIDCLKYYRKKKLQGNW